jgi:hypothetical protein
LTAVCGIPVAQWAIERRPDCHSRFQAADNSHTNRQMRQSDEGCSLLNRFRLIATYHAPNLPQADSNK